MSLSSAMPLSSEGDDRRCLMAIAVQQLAPIAHLPLVLGVLRRLEVATVIDRLIPPHPAHGLSTGHGVEALVLAILDGHHALYKVGEGVSKLLIPCELGRPNAERVRSSPSTTSCRRSVVAQPRVRRPHRVRRGRPWRGWRSLFWGVAGPTGGGAAAPCRSEARPPSGPARGRPQGAPRAGRCTKTGAGPSSPPLRAPRARGGLPGVPAPARRDVAAPAAPPLVACRAAPPRPRPR